MLLEIESLNLSLRESGRALLRGINLSLQEGDSLTVLGMSGSGKTMLCNALLQTLDDTVFHMEGTIRFCGRDLRTLRERDRLALYGGEIVYIPQNPMTAFDPSMRVGIWCRYSAYMKTCAGARQNSAFWMRWRRQVCRNAQGSMRAIHINCPAACSSACCLPWR